MKKIKRIEIFNEDWPSIPENSVEFMKFWQDLIDKAPEEYMDKVEIEICASPCYDSASLEVTVSYAREETDEEERQREQSERDQKERIERREREELAKLRAKYPDA